MLLSNDGSWPRQFIAVTAFLIFTCVTSSRALAISEACPAQMRQAAPVGAPVGQPSISYVYQLGAISPRLVDATMIADTSGGWYAWDVSQVQLAKVTSYAYYSNTQYLRYSDAASAPLGVIFPLAVVVEHAWVVHAKSSGETVMGWDAQGTHQCTLPAFSPGSIAEAQGYSGPRRAAPTPLPSPATFVKAIATSAPFAATACKTPFAAVNVKKPVNPSFPDGLLSPVVALIDVSVDAGGNVIDASARASSGSKSADVQAAQAAASSTYTSGVSYCRPVGGHYLFRADFNPE